jgi:hypothetical protein
VTNHLYAHTYVYAHTRYLIYIRLWTTTLESIQTEDVELARERESSYQMTALIACTMKVLLLGARSCRVKER